MANQIKFQEINYEISSSDSENEDLSESHESNPTIRDYFTVHSNAEFLTKIGNLPPSPSTSTSNYDFFEDDDDKSTCSQKSSASTSSDESITSLPSSLKGLVTLSSSKKKSKKGGKEKSRKSKTKSKDEEEEEQDDTGYRNYHAAHACMQGLRPTMEDDYLVGCYKHYNSYAIFDGHCGSQAAELASKHLNRHFRRIAKELKLPYNVDTTEEKKMKQVMVRSMEAMDNQLFDYFTSTDEELYDGCTAIWLVHDTKRNYFHVANLGDSRCLITQGGKRIFMTKDHKPTDEEEMDRIYDYGGFVANDRVNGNLALSRALGDFEYKQKPYKLQNMLGWKGDIVSRIPEVTHIDGSRFDKTSGEKINILIACDGVFDVYDDVTEESGYMHMIRNTRSISELIDLMEESLKVERDEMVMVSSTDEKIDNNGEDLQACKDKSDDKGKDSDSCTSATSSSSNQIDGSTGLETQAQEARRLEDACVRVMHSAFDLGSTDNISVMLISVSASCES